MVITGFAFITVITLVTHSSRDASSALASPSKVQFLTQRHPITAAHGWWLHLRWSLQPTSDGKEGRRRGRPTGADAGGMGGWRGTGGLERCHPIIGQPLPLGCVLPGGSGQPAGGTTLQLPCLSRRADAGHPHRSHTASAISDRPASQRPFRTGFARERPMARRRLQVQGCLCGLSRDAVGPPATPSADPVLCRVLACAASASQQPLYTQSGPVDTQCCDSCRPPFAISSVIAPAHLAISITSCFGHSGDHEPSLNWTSPPRDAPG